MKMKIQMHDFADSGVLAGSLNGQKTLGLLLAQIKGEFETPEPVFLDFAGIEVATASFLRECILEFRNIVRRRWTTYYPVVANANNTVIEELSILLEPQRDVLILCTLNEDGIPSAARLVGELEPKQRITYDLVKKLGEVGASELMQAANGSERVGQTAWNNRLASLSRLGLLMQTSRGRAKRYRPLPLRG